MPAEKPIPLEGVLNCWNDPYDLPDILLAVSRSGKTGRLSFSNPEADKTLYVKDGRFVFAESSSEDDGLGEYLLRNGQISLEDFTRLSKLASPARRMGALLVAEGRHFVGALIVPAFAELARRLGVAAPDVRHDSGGGRAFVSRPDVVALIQAAVDDVNAHLAQFEKINARAEDFLSRDLPVISVDTKKKELVGNFKNGGTEWQPQDEPELVDVHDFPNDAVGKAIPYGRVLIRS